MKKFKNVGMITKVEQEILDTLTAEEKNKALIRLMRDIAKLQEHVQALEMEIESIYNKGDGGRNFCP